MIAPLSFAEAQPNFPTVWNPFEGFQRRALAASADELLIGGAKGPGKTDLLLVKPLRWAHKALYACAFLRESFRELLRPLDRAHELYGALAADRRPKWSGEKQRFTFPSGAFIQFGYAARLRDLTWTQGGNWADICYDEIGNQPDERVVDTLVSELRCKDPSISRQLCGSANPGFAGHPWIMRRYIRPCGVQGEKIAFKRVKLPNGTTEIRSIQFVPGRVSDNPIYANDAAYMAALMLLPERMKRCLLDGDWTAATGMALDELDERSHLVKPFTCPDHWPWISSFDWGYSHPAVFMYGRVSDDGRVFIHETIQRRLLRDWDLAATYNALVPYEALRNVDAGHDCWQEVKARGDNAPQTAEYFLSCGIHLQHANVARVEGYKNMLQYMAWRETEFLPQRQPMVQFFDTPGNRWAIEQMRSMVNNPDNPVDVLKVNADPETGEGGDDAYDCCVGDTLIHTEEGFRRIDGMVGGIGKCLTPLGWRGYHSVRMTHAASETFTVTNEHGHTFTATANHLCLTARGWVAVRSLRVGDEWVAVDATADYQRCDTGVCGTEVLAHEGRLLSSAREVAAPRGLYGEFRDDSTETPYPPSRREPREQRAGELGGVASEGAPGGAPDARAPRAAAGAYAGGDGTEGAGVALIAGGIRLSQREWQAGYGDASETQEALRTVRQSVRDDSIIRALLPPELQGDGSAQANCRITRIVSVERGPTVATYNLEVDDAECFAVCGGMIVHNCCRYMLAGRPMKAESMLQHLQRSAWDPDVLKREAEKFRRPQSVPADPRQRSGYFPGAT